MNYISSIDNMCNSLTMICDQLFDNQCIFLFVWTFLPKGSFGLQVLSFLTSVCVCPVCVCVNPQLVCTITHYPFKLEIPNLEQTHYNRCNYLSMLGFKLIHVSKGAPGCQCSVQGCFLHLLPSSQQQTLYPSSPIAASHEHINPTPAED